MVAIAQQSNMQHEQEKPVRTIIHGDSLEVLKTLADNSADAIICDPPCGIGFMGKQWDSFDNKKSKKDGQILKDEAEKAGKWLDGRGTLPYGFGGNSIKNDVKSRENFITFLSSIMQEALRVLKPGGHALVWSLPRTSHWTGTALENAGFEMRDCIYHTYSVDAKLKAFYDTLSDEQRNLFDQVLDSQEASSSIMHIFGSGFPKSHNLSVAIDRHLKQEREIVGPGQWSKRGRGIDGSTFKYVASTIGRHITAPSTPEAQFYSGYGSALKPAVENWWLCRKSLSEPTIAANVLKWGTGGLAIDTCRIKTTDKWKALGIQSDTGVSLSGGVDGSLNRSVSSTHPSGRWPSHLLLSHSLFCVKTGTKRIPANSSENGNIIQKSQTNTYRQDDGMEEIESWQCVENCPIRIMDEQSRGKAEVIYQRKIERNTNTISFVTGNIGNNCGYSISGKGGASRYFQQFHSNEAPFLYSSKSSKRERDAGLDDMPESQSFDKNTSKQIAHISHTTGETTYNEYQPSARKNTHPTVKNLSLMQYLVRMITPPDGIVLDPFAGSGSTGIACVMENKGFIGIEREVEYVEIARLRIAYAEKEAAKHEHT